MANRIKHWWNEVKDWQGRFEKLFPTNFLNSIDFKKEKLRMYEQVLSRDAPGLTEDERVSKKALNQERRALEKEVYPNVYVRLFRNILLLAKAMVKATVPGFNSSSPSKNLGSIDNKLEKSGLSDWKEPVHQAIRKGKTAMDFSESNTPTENIDYHFKIAHDERNRPILDGYTATLRDGNNKPTASIHVSEEANLTKENVRALLSGRAINTEGNVWKMPDLNDRDEHGHIKLKEVVVADYNVEQALSKLPIKGINDNTRSGLVEALRAGGRPEVTLTVNGQDKVVSLEANPIKRDINMYADGRKTTMDKLKDTVMPSKKVVPIVLTKKERVANAKRR
ncbi:hypothetical protein [Sphingobacterium sp. MYb388]|uniref:hypothetical protein n=1 Tax=Sphingobacterium sp. MYb388 TaxID=2745437 RepID=UPI0030A857B1